MNNKKFSINLTTIFVICQIMICLSLLIHNNLYYSFFVNIALFISSIGLLMLLLSLAMLYSKKLVYNKNEKNVYTNKSKYMLNLLFDLLFIFVVIRYGNDKKLILLSNLILLSSIIHYFLMKKIKKLLQ